ncbi:MAG: hypothetical protein QGH93_06695 [Gammaproteobacteria bacterium]|nr:hypothetical protein [Gammaproteobacteria bacterium]
MGCHHGDGHAARDPTDHLHAVRLPADHHRHDRRRRQRLADIDDDSATSGIPVPAIASTFSWYDGYRYANGSVNLIQAERDYFSTHGYERVDRTVFFKFDGNLDNQNSLEKSHMLNLDYKLFVGIYFYLDVLAPPALCPDTRQGYLIDDTRQGRETAP